MAAIIDNCHPVPTSRIRNPGDRRPPTVTFVEHGGAQTIPPLAAAGWQSRLCSYPRGLTRRLDGLRSRPCRALFGDIRGRRRRTQMLLCTDLWMTCGRCANNAATVVQALWTTWGVCVCTNAFAHVRDCARFPQQRTCIHSACHGEVAFGRVLHLGQQAESDEAVNTPCDVGDIPVHLGIRRRGTRREHSVTRFRHLRAAHCGGLGACRLWVVVHGSRVLRWRPRSSVSRRSALLWFTRRPRRQRPLSRRLSTSLGSGPSTRHNSVHWPTTTTDDRSSPPADGTAR